MRHFTAAAAALCTLSLAFIGSAQAQSYPERPVTMIVPWAPGGAADIIARLVAEPMGDTLGQPVVIENRPGAGGTVGSAVVANADPDGYTILMGNVSSEAIAPAFYADTIPYNVLEDFAPVSQLVEQPNVLLVATDSEFDTVQDLMSYLKANPGELYATPGVGNSPYLTFELIKDVYGVEMENVPYDSGAEVNNALAAGDIEIAINNLPGAMKAIQSGTAKPLAVTAPQRNPLLPDVPTFAEAGADSILAISWQGIFAPAGTPDDVVNKIYEAAAAALKDDNVIQRNKELGSVPVGSTPQEFKAFVASEIKNWAHMVELADAKAPN
ncbi:Bug family tripartite tricarboxylate transporter substrate binding protein [Amorphus sp. 3PC139-8]|uniref:Bug family tripartite tricarboxylate transporter substrate binding protein n=1 Tax=Amorphus sp. 3PC139-8 TaxID=2735676 RepID=UPI00345CA47B